jgi:branched-subunit amino acid transport protein
VAPVTWLVVLVVGLATVAIKGAGPVALGGRRLPARLAGVVALFGPALLAGLVAVQVFGGDRRLVVDARAAGLAVAAVALALRAPVLVAAVLAAATTAAVRAVAGG